LGDSLEPSAAEIKLNYFLTVSVACNQSLKVTPAMAAGVTDRLWEMTDVEMLEAFEASRKQAA
jgi:hypothetical protein